MLLIVIQGASWFVVLLSMLAKLIAQRPGGVRVLSTTSPGGWGQEALHSMAQRPGGIRVLAIAWTESWWSQGAVAQLPCSVVEDP